MKVGDCNVEVELSRDIDILGFDGVLSPSNSKQVSQDRKRVSADQYPSQMKQTAFSQGLDHPRDGGIGRQRSTGPKLGAKALNLGDIGFPSASFFLEAGHDLVERRRALSYISLS